MLSTWHKFKVNYQIEMLTITNLDLIIIRLITGYTYELTSIPVSSSSLSSASYICIAENLHYQHHHVICYHSDDLKVWLEQLGRCTILVCNGCPERPIHCLQVSDVSYWGCQHFSTTSVEQHWGSLPLFHCFSPGCVFAMWLVIVHEAVVADIVHIFYLLATQCAHMVSMTSIVLLDTC